VETARETSGLTLRAILVHVRERGGEDAVLRVLERAGATGDPVEYEDPRRWWSYRLKIKLFEAAAEVLGDDRIGLAVARSVLTSSVGSAQRFVLSLAGGPSQLLRLVARANSKFSTAAEMRALRVRRGAARVDYRLFEQHEPSRHDCEYTRGLLMIAPAIFGLPLADVRHDTCQVRGAHACEYEVRWRVRRRWWSRGRGSADDPMGVVMAAQLQHLQDTVGELVSARDPDQALATVADRAGYAVHAHAFLLRARPSPDQPPRVYGFNLTQADLDEYAKVGSVDGTGSSVGANRLLVPIASPEREYGHLMAFGDHFLPTDRDLLASYANLTAVTLDALFALETAAARRRTAEGLLGLARALAAARSVEEVARVTVDAAAALMNADRACVMLFDDESKLRVVAHHGWDPGYLDKLSTLVVTGEDTAAVTRLRNDPRSPQTFDRDCPDAYLRGLLDDFGLNHIATVGIARPGRVYGALILGFEAPGNTASGREFAPHATGLADQAATAVHSCELLEQTMRLAHADPLTGVPNRRAFMSQLAAAVQSGPGAVLFLDLNGFKQINDNFGHAAGDELLVASATRLRAAVRAEDMVARLAGDEFVVLTRGCVSETMLAELRDRTATAFATPVDLLGQEVTVRASIGSTTFHAGENSEEVLHRADLAMYEAKATTRVGRG
jgi:diguanylate cyclase (GGDEF)-like protein